MIPHCGRDLRSIAAGGDNGVAGARGCLGDVDAQAPASPGDAPDLSLSHGMILIWTRATARPFPNTISVLQRRLLSAESLDYAGT
ncbi:MAG TPA: hypothetical protein VH701_25180 [Vicinamibacterales bacterium]